VITKLKDGRTHLAYNAEHAVDLERAVVAITMASGDVGDTATIFETLPLSGEHIAKWRIQQPTIKRPRRWISRGRKTSSATTAITATTRLRSYENGKYATTSRNGSGGGGAGKISTWTRNRVISFISASRGMRGNRAKVAIWSLPMRTA